MRDVRRLSVLRDPSIAKVVAMATNFGPAPACVSGDEHQMGLMTEYLEGGPLPLYLRQYRVGPTDNADPGVKTIRYAISAVDIVCMHRAHHLIELAASAACFTWRARLRPA